MAFYTNLAEVHKNRTLKPRYARTQATPKGVVLATEVTADVFPGMVLAQKSDGTVVPCDETKIPAGLCGNWTRELEYTNSRDIAMWVPGNDAELLVFAPAFDGTADWTTAKTNLDAGKEVLLCSNANGYLTVATADDATRAKFRLVGIEGSSCIVVAGLL